MCYTKKCNVLHTEMQCITYRNAVGMHCVTHRNKLCYIQKCNVLHTEMQCVTLRNAVCYTQKCSMLHRNAVCYTEMQCVTPEFHQKQCSFVKSFKICDSQKKPAPNAEFRNGRCLMQNSQMKNNLPKYPKCFGFSKNIIYI